MGRDHAGSLTRTAAVLLCAALALVMGYWFFGWPVPPDVRNRSQHVRWAEDMMARLEQGDKDLLMEVLRLHDDQGLLRSRRDAIEKAVCSTIVFPERFRIPRPQYGEVRTLWLREHWPELVQWIRDNADSLVHDEARGVFYLRADSQGGSSEVETQENAGSEPKEEADRTFRAGRGDS